MNIGLLPLRSDLADSAAVAARWNPYWRALGERLGGPVASAPPERAGDFDLYMVNVQTGGSEPRFAELLPRLPRPIRLLSSPFLNSLPAALEMLAYARRLNARAELVHGDPQRAATTIRSIGRCELLQRALRQAAVGVVGGSSEWLIASRVDPAAVAARHGLRLVEVPMEELAEAVRGADSAAAAADAARWRTEASAGGEATPEDVLGASRIYLGLRELCRRHKLEVVTVRCFDLLSLFRNTGCLALSRLNGEGVIAGCEGDVPAAVSMLVAERLAGAPAFMANVADVRADGRQVWLAHCTLPRTLAGSYRLRSHFESGLGVGLQGDLAPGPVTLFKLGGPGLERAFVAAGELEENTDRTDECRTQVRVRLRGGTDYFHRRPLGNHHILVPGDVSADLRRFLEDAGVESESV